MAFANVNIGTYPADGNGDPIRTAFNKINQNFANIANGSVTVNAPVRSVAGRTGNVRLNVGDVAGAASNSFVIASNTSMTNYVNSQIASSIATGNIAFVMGNYQHWNGNVTTISSALDQLAERLKSAGF